MARTILLLTVFFIGVLPASAANHDRESWYTCTAWGASHTGHYTFRIQAKACRVYWLEIATQMKLLSCKNGIIKALKPSALSNEDIVFFNMNTGQFYDNLSGVLDRGSCERVVQP